MLRYSNKMKAGEKKIFLILALIVTFSFNTQSFAEELIAYSRLSGDYWQIWFMHQDGQNKRQITFSKQDKREPAWSAYSSKIAYRTNNGQLFTINLSNGEEKEILRKLHNINNPYCSNVSDEVVFVRFNPSSIDVSDIWKAGINGQKAVLLTKDKKLKYQPVFSPHADKIAFVQAETENSHHIWIMDRDGRNKKKITNGKGLDVRPSFSPDSKAIIFASNRQEDNYEIYTVNIKTGIIQRITRNHGMDTSPQFSMDGEKIIFVSNRSGSQQIWVVSKDGASPVQLTFGPNESIDPVWVKILEKKEP